MTGSERGPLTVVGIVGSLRDGSFTAMAVRQALLGAAELNAQTELIDLRDYELPFCDGRSKDRPYPDDVYRLRAKVKAAHGVILGTPEYHGSYSGVLKNALDLMGFEEFTGKMMGLVGVSAGAMGGIDALNALRTVGRTLHAWVVPQQAAIAEVYKHFSADGEIDNERLRNRVRDVGRMTARFAYLHHSEKTREFMRLWEEAPTNPGAQEQ